MASMYTDLASFVQNGGDPIWEDVTDSYGEVEYQVLDYDYDKEEALVAESDAEEDENGTLPGEWVLATDVIVLR